MLFEWYELTIEALQDLWQGFVGFIPNLVGAFVVFIIGWFIAIIVGKIIAEILRKVQLDKVFAKGTMKEALAKAEFKVDVSGFIGAIFKWVLVIVFLLVAVDILGINQFSGFLTNVLNYIPNIVVAVLIFVVAIVIADILEKIVRAAVESAKVGYGNLSGAIVRWSIWVFAIIAILLELGIANQLIQTILNGIIALIAIAGGIAFGLGGKDAAAETVRNIKAKFQR